MAKENAEKDAEILNQELQENKIAEKDAKILNQKIQENEKIWKRRSNHDYHFKRIVTPIHVWVTGANFQENKFERWNKIERQVATQKEGLSHKQRWIEAQTSRRNFRESVGRGRSKRTKKPKQKKPKRELTMDDFRWSWHYNTYVRVQRPLCN